MELVHSICCTIMTVVFWSLPEFVPFNWLSYPHPNDLCSVALIGLMLIEYDDISDIMDEWKWTYS